MFASWPNPRVHSVIVGLSMQLQLVLQIGPVAAAILAIGGLSRLARKHFRRHVRAASMR